MKRIFLLGIVGVLLSAAAGSVVAAPSRQDLLREVLRQQSSAERSICGGIKRTLEAGSDADLVVKTAIELGYAPCPVIRCALEAGADLEKVIQGAADAGALPEVASRCAIEAGADPDAVAALVADLFFEPSFCYFAPEGTSSAGTLPVGFAGTDRQYQQAEFSRFQP